MSITIDGDTGKVIDESDSLAPYKPPKQKTEFPPELIMILKMFAAILLREK